MNDRKDAAGSDHRTVTADSPTPRERLIDLTTHYGHLSCFRGAGPLLVRANAHTYVPARATHPGLDHTWLSMAFGGLERLRDEVGPGGVRRAAMIGTGDGLDASGVSRLFDTELIVASDLHPEVLDIARANIARLARPGARIDVIRSDLLRQYPADARFDLVYENLPNIPEADDDIYRGLRTASCFEASRYVADAESARHLLTLHHALLVDAAPHLAPGGRVVSAIGGRVPWSVIAAMFHRAGYEPGILHFGLKVQTEADIVLDGYARAERAGGPEFTFYHPLEECARIARECGVPGSTATAEAFADRMNGMLAGCRVSASRAVTLAEAGKDVCHTIYVVGGTRKIRA